MSSASNWRFEWLKAVTQAENLLPAAKVIATALSVQFANDETRQIDPKVTTLADYVKMSIPTIKRAIRALVDAGWLGKTEGRGRGNHTSYALLSPGKIISFSTQKKGVTSNPLTKEKGSPVILSIIRINNLLNKGRARPLAVFHHYPTSAPGLFTIATPKTLPSGTDGLPRTECHHFKAYRSEQATRAARATGCRCVLSRQTKTINTRCGAISGGRLISRRSAMQRNDAWKAKRPSEQITDLVQRIRRLCPDHRDPHRFHEEKSEIAFELTKLAQRVA